MKNDTEGTLRDLFAAQAMSGLRAHYGDKTMGSEQFAELAYEQADAMLKERIKNESK